MKYPNNSKEYEKKPEEIAKNQNFWIFLYYFKKFFIMISYDESILNGSYSIKFWTFYKNVILELLKGTNVFEAWHRTLNFASNIDHPNIARFLQIFTKFEEKESECMFFR